MKLKYLFVGLFITINLNDGFTQVSIASFKEMSNLNFFNKSMASLKHANEVMQDNEFERNDKGNDTNIHANPLILNGYSLDYSIFDLNSRGFLSVVKGKPETTDAKPLPFYVLIRRNGVQVEDKKMLFLNKILTKVNLSDIFPFCKNGDMLIIKPVNTEDWKAKRILKLIAAGC
jgi:hypothetical protein